ncbi:MAG: ferric reductase-like transmembrane domain-containing protein [Pseudomonadota bacterium]
MTRAVLIWAGLAAALVVPVVIAAGSPFLQWRSAVYIAAGFAGIVAMGLLLVQPLLAGGYLPGLTIRFGRRVHVWVGIGLVGAVIAHVVGLWLTSPPDVVDVLLFRSPTPFSDWGVIAMWAVFAAAALAAMRKKLRLRPRFWRFWHLSLASVVVVGSVVHALLIEGTMGTVSKVVLCALAVAALAKAIWDQRPRTWRVRR